MESNLAQVPLVFSMVLYIGVYMGVLHRFIKSFFMIIDFRREFGTTKQRVKL